jgi:hypothetical protein
MKETIMALYNAIVAGDKQAILDTFADLLEAIFGIVKNEM